MKTGTPGCETEKLANSFGVPYPGGENVLYQAVYDNSLTVLVLVSIRGSRGEVKLHNELTNLANQYSAKLSSP